VVSIFFNDAKIYTAMETYKYFANIFSKKYRNTALSFNTEFNK
jgi:hypothetical protein